MTTRLLATAAALLALTAPSAFAQSSPTDPDGDGIPTPPRLAGGGGTYRACLTSGVERTERDANKSSSALDRRIERLGDAFAETGSWRASNVKRLPAVSVGDLTACIRDAQASSNAGDAFVFAFTGHANDTAVSLDLEAGEGPAAAPHDDALQLRDGVDLTDDALAGLLSGFRQGVAVTVVLTSCPAVGFADGAADLNAVTQVPPGGGAPVPVGGQLALLAADSAAQPVCTAGYGDKVAEALGVRDRRSAGDANKDGIVTAREVSLYARTYDQVLPSLCADATACPAPSGDGRSSIVGATTPVVDGCPLVADPRQADADKDGIGDVCAPERACPGGRVTLEGTDRPETLVGTIGKDVIAAFGGNDTIRGLGEDDIICGGDGNDRIDGGASRDVIDAGAGNDTVFGRSGRDTVHGGPGNDRIDTDGSRDTVFGDEGDDNVTTGLGNDHIDGGPGNDRLNAQVGQDVVRGGSGNDVINDVVGCDKLYGGPGNDTIRAGDCKDLVRGDAGNDVLYGGTSHDRLFGGSGRDRLFGERGIDRLDGGPGNDVLDGGTDGDTCVSGGGNDRRIACESG